MEEGWSGRDWWSSFSVWGSWGGVVGLPGLFCRSVDQWPHRDASRRGDWGEQVCTENPKFSMGLGKAWEVTQTFLYPGESCRGTEGDWCGPGCVKLWTLCGSSRDTVKSCCWHLRTMRGQDIPGKGRRQTNSWKWTAHSLLLSIHCVEFEHWPGMGRGSRDKPERGKFLDMTSLLCWTGWDVVGLILVLDLVGFSFLENDEDSGLIWFSQKTARCLTCPSESWLGSWPQWYFSQSCPCSVAGTEKMREPGTGMEDPLQWNRAPGSSWLETVNDWLRVWTGLLWCSKQGVAVTAESMPMTQLLRGVKWLSG